MADVQDKRVLPLQYVKGVGPRRAEVLAAEGISTARDVVLNVPRSYIQREAVPSIRALLDSKSKTKEFAEGLDEIRSTTEVTLLATVISTKQQLVGKRKNMLKVTVSDGTGTAALVFWNFIEYYKKQFVEGQTILISGSPDFDPKWNQLSFHHPDVEKVESEDSAALNEGAILPKYRMSQAMRTAGISMALLRSIVDSVLEDVLSSMHEVLPNQLIAKYQYPPKAEALRELHRPQSMNKVNKARERMKFEELFVFEMCMAAKQRSRKSRDRGVPIQTKSASARKLVESLPYSLTSAQKRVIHEIMGDMAGPAPMNRLLQGDVGSGKTIVAVLCMLAAVDSGFQALIMAPTELLAEQHAAGIRRLLEGSDVIVEQLVGGQRKKIREDIRSRIASGEVHIVVGTHAAFEANIEYHKLGMIVIDEQHRFGVAQRAEIRRMGIASHGTIEQSPHILVMSATPIPRTLSMTLYGDLEVSIIDELPANRIPISTHVVFESTMDEVYQHTIDHIRQGRQAYVVYPLVEKSEKVAAKSAVEHFEVLRDTVFDEFKVGLLHGQMLWYEKEDTMKAFLNREYDVLVATTVIEVGIDVSNATIMIIENAERFGLSQLHQLRGRVGRGAHESFCFLATKDHFRYALGSSSGDDDRAASVTRLRTMVATNDGFKIAEADLALRGPGDMLGTRQSGMPEFSFANLVTDGAVLMHARNDAFRIFSEDPQLRKPEHVLIREHLVRMFDGSGSFIFVA